MGVWSQNVILCLLYLCFLLVCVCLCVYVCVCVLIKRNIPISLYCIIYLTRVQDAFGCFLIAARNYTDKTAAVSKIVNSIGYLMFK